MYLLLGPALLSLTNDELSTGPILSVNMSMVSDKSEI